MEHLIPEAKEHMSTTTPSLQFTHFFFGLLSDSKNVPLPKIALRSLWKIGWLRSWRLHCNFNRLRPGFGWLKGLKGLKVTMVMTGDP